MFKLEKREIIYKKLNELKPYENNPRINDGAVEGVKKSIEEFGFNVPIVVDENNVIVAGHTRFKAAKQLNLKEVPCICLKDLTESQIKAFRLVDNKVSELAIWNEDLLNLELGELQTLEINLDDFGFENINPVELTNENEEKEEKKELIPVDDFKVEDEIIEELKNKKVFFTFSGGKDSSVCAFLMMPILKANNIDFELVFVDTGVEIPSTQEFVVRFADHFGAKLHIVRGGEDFFEHYEKKKKFPSAIFRDCIGELINTPANKYMATQCEEGEEFIVIRGGRPNQKTKLSKMQKIYTTSDGYRLFNPLYDLSEEGFEKYKSMLEAEFGIWEGYSRGFVRSACWCCPFQRKVQYETIKRELPFLWEVLKRKAEEWEFQGVTPLQKYVKGDLGEVDKLADEFEQNS